MNKTMINKSSSVDKNSVKEQKLLKRMVNCAEDNIEILQSAREDITTNPTKIPVKRKAKEVNNILLHVPQLLLSYTYFLNEQHSAYISIGYDTYDFNFKAILFKNSSFQVLNYENWTCLYRNMHFIKKYFSNTNNETSDIFSTHVMCVDNVIELQHFSDDRYYDVQNTEVLQKNNISLQLLVKKNEKCLLLSGGAPCLRRKVYFIKEEFDQLFELAAFLNIIINWCNAVWKEVEMYYHDYSDQCVKQHIVCLPPEDFFIPPQGTIQYCNYSRLFYEIPILCKNRLASDYHKYFCSSIQ